MARLPRGPPTVGTADEFNRLNPRKSAQRKFKEQSTLKRLGMKNDNVTVHPLSPPRHGKESHPSQKSVA